MKNLMSLIKVDFVSTLVRFKWAIGFALVFTILVLSRVWHADYVLNSSHEYGTAMFYCFTAMLLSLAIRLSTEDKPMTLKVGVVATIAHILLLLHAILLWKKEDLYLESTYACLALVVGLLLAIALLPFLRQKNDGASWNFVLQLFRGAAIGLLVGGLMSIGIVALLQALLILFDLNILDKWYITLLWLLDFLLPLLLWMGLIPEGEKKYVEFCVVSRFWSGVVRYLFLPILALYILVLYIYGLQILVDWRLPDGGVVGLVSAMMFGMIGIIFLLYPRLLEERQGFERKLVMALPIAVLPLLMLMSVGLYRRFADYGVTPARLYAVLLNLWFYGVCLGLLFNRGRRIHWIALSFGVLFLLSSVLPINFSTIGLRAVKTSLNELWNNTPPPEKPMKQEDFNRWISKFSDKEKEEIIERLKYLRHEYGYKEVAQWVAEETELNSTPFIEREKDYDYQYDQAIPIPEEGKMVRYCNFDVDSLTQDTVYLFDGQHLHFSMPTEILKKTDEHPNRFIEYALPEGQGKVIFISVRGSLPEGDKNGYLYVIEGLWFKEK